MAELAAFFVLYIYIYLVSCQRPFIELDANNVHGYIPSPGQSVGKVRHLGKFDNVESCVRACVENKDGRCLTFTYHTMRFEGDFAGHCYGGIEEPLWSPMPERHVLSGKIMWPCRSGMDCSLNGKCENERCRCRRAWRGIRCDELSLLPVERESGYHYMEDGRNISSWGGAVLRGKDGMYHMYAAEMTEHCGINSWNLNSQIIHATSDDPVRTYKRQGVVHAPFAHEPDAVMGPDGEFVLFWSAFKFTDVPLCQCIDGSTPPNCKTPDTHYWTYMSYSKDPYGPWSDPVHVISKNATGSDNNFAPVILKDGRLVGFIRSGGGSPGHEGSRIHTVMASNWKDPSTYIESYQDIWPNLPTAGTEDPFVYLDEDGYFHAIFHNMYPSDIQENCGGHAYSMDGRNWVYGGKAFGNRVEFTDGTSFSFTRRERPHFVFAEDGVTPLALTNGAQYGGKYGDATYTLLQRVEH